MVIPETERNPLIARNPDPRQPSVLRVHTPWRSRSGSSIASSAIEESPRGRLRDALVPRTPMTDVDQAITSRRSIRRFLPTPVPAETVEHILDVAARAPSGTNMQPWQGYALAGAAKQALIDAVQAAFDAQEDGHHQEVQYY